MGWDEKGKGKAQIPTSFFNHSLDDNGNRVKHKQCPCRIKSIFHFRIHAIKISVLTYSQDLNMILPAIVSMEQMASVQIHKLRQCVLKPFLPALWLAVAAGAPGQRSRPQWAALSSPHPKPGSRDPCQSKVTAALVGPCVSSLCADNGQEGIPTEINDKTHMARTLYGVPGGSWDNSAIASATSERMGDTKKNLKLNQMGDFPLKS